ncbi:MAG: hypothetical protein KA957_04760 [Syntrophaceae bacterium]|nr:hypothetical protein [Syntrophaceae bacterium]
MKMFLVVYAEASDESITEAFKQAGYRSYTKIRGATGEGVESEPKLDSHIWPGRNNTLMLAVPDPDVGRLIDLVRRLRDEHPRAGLRAFTFPLEECV